MVKNLPANARDEGDVGLTPGLGRFSRGGHDNPFQYSCLGNPMDRGAGELQFAKSRTRLTEHACRGSR